MSYATVQSCTLSGVNALPVTVEVHIAGGLPGMSIVGLPQSAVRESKDRVKAAIRHAGFKFPQVRIIVNLAPADLPKHGGRFDLPISLGVLVANGQLDAALLENKMVLGELGLTGQVRSVSGVLPTALALAGTDQTLIIPQDNAAEARLSQRTRLQLASDLRTLVEELAMPMQSISTTIPSVVQCNNNASESLPDMRDVKGQQQARRALEITAAGGHNLLMVGPPGTGKSMLASRLPGIVPAMTERESMEVASIASITYTGFHADQWGVRPFRSPHHTASGVALVWWWSRPMPGEISLSHNGVLFLDELTEYPRAVLDVLREPMETGRITISRAAKQADFPARFQLVAAMNPCPCGYDGDEATLCSCTPDQITRYRQRVSGPFLDRIDLHIRVPRLSRSVLADESEAESSEVIRGRVEQARECQLGRQMMNNALLHGKALEQHCALHRDATALLNTAADKLQLSLRACHRVLRVARTIADLAGAGSIETSHLAEALGYR